MSIHGRYNLRKLDRAIQKSGRTQREIAASAGVHEVTMSRLLTGRTCSFGTVAKVSRAVGLSVTDLVRRNGK